MPSPSAALSTLRPELGGSLEEFAMAAEAQGFIALQAAPAFEAAKQSGSYGIIPIEQLLQTRDTERAPGSGYARGRFDFTKASFATVEHGAEEPVDDREAEMYREYFDAELVATRRARNVVLRNLEIRMATALFNATTWTATAITNEWDDFGNAVPITDVAGRVNAVWDACGMWPDTMIVNGKVARNLKQCDEVIDLVKYAGFTDPTNIPLSAIAQAMGLQRILVGEGAKNTAKEGQDVSISPIWSDEYALVCKTVQNPQDIREPGVARTIHWGEDGSTIGTTVETYRDESVRSNVVRARLDTDEIVMYVEAAALLSNVTT